MTEHIHKRLTEEQVRMILERYVHGELKREQALNLLGLKHRRFFKLVKRFKENPDGFTIAYYRKKHTRKIDKSVEKNIENELKTEKTFIDDPSISIRFYNYSFIRDELMKKYGQEVSLPTIIDRAKKRGFTSINQKRFSMTGR